MEPTLPKISTADLLGRLFKTHDLGRFLEDYAGELEAVPFSAYLGRLCQAKGLTAAQVIREAGIDRSFGYQLLSGRRTPSRDTVIRFALGLCLGYSGAQDLLKIARKSPLYAKIKRDAVIIYALGQGCGVPQTQATLSELGLPVLGKEAPGYE
jgi:transcriptional regulator with XRE-family HTH domain